MSSTTVRSIRALAEATLVEAAWAQWSVLTTAALAVGERRAWTIVDPEALILASLAAGQHERRLIDLVAGWTDVARTLMSMQRLRTLARHFPDRVQGDLDRYTALALPGSRMRHAAAATSDYYPRRKTVSLSRLTEPAALTLRLRAGMGVTAKADLLSLLLGLNGESADLKVIAAGTAYTERTIRIAVREMTLADFIQEIEGRPSSYYVTPDAWTRVLQDQQPSHTPADFKLPPWRFWWAVFAFLAGVVEWGDRAEAGNWTEYVASSRARDLLEHHQRRLRQAQLEYRDTGKRTGEHYLDEFESLVRGVRIWAERGLRAQ